jgi:glycerophosphoryl diester phosphodiesterase
MSASSLDWLRRPFAHRGLHDARQGIVENSASAFRAAIAADYGVEVDLQCASDGVPVVFHDESLDRLTEERGLVRERDSASLAKIALKGSSDAILTLPQLLAIVGDRVPLLIEIKSSWGRDDRYAKTIADALSGHWPNIAIMSFDHELIANFRDLAPTLQRGLISERFEDARYWHMLSPLQRFAMRHLLTAAMARPDFIAYHVKALPALAPTIARKMGLPVITWTVRDKADEAVARRYADAIIFEGIRP